MTETSDLLDYLKIAWTLGTPGTADIHWSEGWYNPQYPNMYQVTCTPFFKPVNERFRTVDDINYITRNLFHFNTWKRIDIGMQGSLEIGSVQAITRELCEVFRKGIADNYGGSLSRFGAVLPADNGMPLHEKAVIPHYFRYQVSVIATEHFNT